MFGDLGEQFIKCSVPYNLGVVEKNIIVGREGLQLLLMLLYSVRAVQNPGRVPVRRARFFRAHASVKEKVFKQPENI